MEIEAVSVPRRHLPGGCEIPVYGLGTWGMGGRMQRDTRDDSRFISAIRAAIDAGVTHIDTAEMYGGGHAEELVGKAIEGLDRSSLFIASKALAHHLHYEGLISAAEQSLRRLGTPYLDLYMIHHPSDETPIGETMEAMDQLVQSGKVRFVGVSNFLKERLAAARQASPQPIVANQVHYSVAFREPEQTGLLEYCREHGVLLMAWQPIDRGLYQEQTSPVLARLARKYQKTPVQTALNWLVSQDNVAAISRTTSLNHLYENLGALTWQMEPEDIELLRTEYSPQHQRSDVYPLR